MGFDITSNYSGEHAGQYIAAALKSATSLEYLNVLENVKFKRNITTVAGASLVGNASCDFNDAGTLTLTERILNPKELQINVDLCRKDLIADWQAAQMRAGAHNRDMSGDFTAFVMSYLSGTIADAVETSIWSGDEDAAGQFEGFLTATSGYFANDTLGGEIDNAGGAGTAYTASNIIANLQALVAGVPAQVYTKDDLYIYMNAKSYRFYISAISALSAFPFNHMGQYSPEFEGVKIAVCQGMPDNQMVAAQKSNLFFGTDLISDHSEIKMLDLSDITGSDVVRVVAKFTGGVQHGIGADITRID